MISFERQSVNRWIDSGLAKNTDYYLKQLFLIHGVSFAELTKILEDATGRE